MFITLEAVEELPYQAVLVVAVLAALLDLAVQELQTLEAVAVLVYLPIANLVVKVVQVLSLFVIKFKENINGNNI